MFLQLHTLDCSHTRTHEDFPCLEQTGPSQCSKFSSKIRDFLSEQSCCLSQFLCFCIHPPSLLDLARRPWTHHFLHNVPSIFSHLSGSRSREQFLNRDTHIFISPAEMLSLQRVSGLFHGLLLVEVKNLT